MFGLCVVRIVNLVVEIPKVRTMVIWVEGLLGQLSIGSLNL